jgi:hypothetical protein
MNAATFKLAEIFSGILSYELRHTRDGMLLSEEFDRWIERYPIGARVLILTAGVIITAHCANVVPNQMDLLSKALWRRVLRRGEHWTGANTRFRTILRSST